MTTSASFTDIVPLVVSISEPVTRVPSLTPSRVNSPRKEFTASVPTSPRKIGKHNRWSMAKKHSMTVPTSPTRALRKHNFAASFGSAPRPMFSRPSSASPCSIHSYSEVSSTFRSTHSSFAMAKGERITSAPTHGPSVHSYASAPSSFKSTHSSFSTDKSERMTAAPTHGPATHSYAEPVSTLKPMGVSFSTSKLERMPPMIQGPNVHSYAAAPSSFKSTHASFAMAKGERMTAAPTHGPKATHSYELCYSSFGQSGRGVSFGSTAPRSALAAVSRTGLLSAASTTTHTATRPAAPKNAPLASLSRPATATTRVRSRLEAALQSSSGALPPDVSLKIAAPKLAHSKTEPKLVPVSRPRMAAIEALDQGDKENFTMVAAN